MNYMVDLEVFHGPLDLLLYLIDKNEIDIYDIPISVITDQYIEYLHSTGKYDLDFLGDFLIMASYLLNLKSRLLIPQLFHNEQDNQEEDFADPREELVQRLIDYKKYKKVCEYLEARQNGTFKRVFFRASVYEAEDKEEIVASISALTRAYQAILRKQIVEEPINIPRKDINVGEKMSEILDRLKDFNEGIVFQDLFSGILSRREALVLFLALLELVRQKKVVAMQEKEFSEIKVYLTGGG